MMTNAYDAMAGDYQAGGADLLGRRPPLPLRELVRRPELLEPPPAIISNIAYRGRVTLLSAREKMGKSTIMGQAAAFASCGRTFLGEPTDPSVVLWYAIDEPLGDAVRRFSLHAGDQDRVIIQPERPNVRQFRAEIIATDANLVVIDVLSALWSGRIESDRDAADVSKFLRPYVGVARETKTAVVILHHTTKDGEQYRGSVELGAAVDLVLNFGPARRRKKPGEGAVGEEGEEEESDDGTRKLCGRGRGVDVDLRLSYYGGQYWNYRPLELPIRILLELATGAASANALIPRLGARRQSVLDELRRLKDTGEATNSDQQYHITNLGHERLAREGVVDGSRLAGSNSADDR